MACQRRENTGSCSHHQCEFSKETEHGYECVDIISGYGVDFCEVGDSCLSKCPYSYGKLDGSAQDLAAASYMRANLEILEDFNKE